MSFEVGQKFKSYEELKNYMKEYESSFKQKFWKRSSRRIESVNLRKCFNKNIIYYEIHYSCIHSGTYKTRGKGLRKSSTQRIDCPAFMKLRADETGQALEVKSLNDQHMYHDHSTDYDQNSGLTEEQKPNARIYLGLGVNKKQIRQQLYSETGTEAILKNLANIQQTQRKIDKDSLSECVKNIEEQHGGKVSVLEEDSFFKGMFFTTEYMQKNMSDWPEFLAVDSTCKLRNGCTVNIFLIEDSNGESRVAGVGVMASEDQATFAWLVRCFKLENPSWVETRCLMTDKNVSERNVLKTEFPGIPTYLCLLHTMKTFRREITVEKFDLTKTSKEVCLKYLSKLVCSKNEDEYNKIYEEFQKSVPDSVFQYFNNSWHSIRKEWLPPFLMPDNLQNNTNNRLETINKIKQVIKENGSFPEFIQSFFIWLECQEYDITHSMVEHVLNKPTIEFPNNSPEAKYKDFLTNFAFQYVVKQFNLSENVALSKLDNATFLVKSSSENIQVTNQKCSCSDGHSMGLPCRHIFAVRRTLEEELFSELLCNKRWTKSYYISVSLKQESDSVLDGSTSTTDITKPHLFFEKRKNAMAITNDLVNLVSYSSKDIYDYKISVLKNIVDSWKQGFEVIVRTVDKNNVKPSNLGELVNSATETVMPSEKICSTKIKSTSTTIPENNIGLSEVIKWDNCDDETNAIAEKTKISNSFTLRETAENTHANHENTEYIPFLFTTPNKGHIPEEINDNCINGITDNDTTILPPETPDNINPSAEKQLLLSQVIMPHFIKKRGRSSGMNLPATVSKKRRFKKVPKRK